MGIFSPLLLSSSLIFIKDFFRLLIAHIIGIYVDNLATIDLNKESSQPLYKIKSPQAINRITGKFHKINTSYVSPGLRGNKTGFNLVIFILISVETAKMANIPIPISD